MTKREIPQSVYAAAGAGDLAYQQLRKLPEAAARTLRSASAGAQEWRQRVAAAPPVDLARVRESAQRNAAVVVAGAVTVQERAVTGYRTLVARGEQVLAERAGTDQPIKAAPPAEIETAKATAAKTTGARASDPSVTPNAANPPVPQAEAAKPAAKKSSGKRPSA